MPTRLTLQDPEGKTLRRLVLEDDRRTVLSDVLAANGFPLNTRCGKQGWCHGCIIELVNNGGVGELLQAAKSCEMTLEPGCETVIRIPRHARLESAPQVGDSFATDTPAVLYPPWPVQPSVKDTALAIDIGTTTVAAALIDLEHGDVLGRAGNFNAQIRFGDNVVTRMVAAGKPGGLAEMRQAVIEETLLPLVQRLCADAGRSPGRLAGCSVSGNTTMLHILAGEDPAGLGMVPFTPVFLESRELPSRTLGLPGDYPVRLLPGLSAYVGADIAAGIYASGVANDNVPGMLVDIGTNGEIVLQCRQQLLACATAAGPAFEGAGLTAGTRAQAGAICHLHLHLDAPFRLDLETIGGLDPAQAPGLCGTAYIDFLAEGRASGLLLSSGRFDSERWHALPVHYRTSTPGGRGLRLTEKLTICEADIASLLQAKAAISAGIGTLLRAANLLPEDIGHLYLAGGFGLFIDVDHALAVGLLPGFERSQIKVCGNTALAGAVLACVDRNAMVRMEEFRQSIRIVELNEQPGFEDCFLDGLMLP